MSSITVKEWAEAYRRNNEWEQQERLTRLPQETIEESVRAYFALCTMLLKFANEADQDFGLWERRLEDYKTLIERWQRLARQRQHAAQP
jgi:hypothetical protein